MSTDWEALELRDLVPPLPAQAPTAEPPTVVPPTVVLPTVVEAELLPGMSETDTFIGGFRKLLDALGYESGWQAVPNPLTGGVKLRLAAQRREG